MASVSIDMSEVDAFAANLAGIPSELSRHLVPPMKRAAQNIKTDQQEDFRASSHGGFQAIASHVSYDEISVGAGGYETEIGIDKGGAGSLANLAIFGSYKGGGTHMHPSYYARQEMPRFEAALEGAIEELFS